MFYKFSSTGYSAGVYQITRGPWIKVEQGWVEHDGLDWFYSFLDNSGNKVWLASNNIPLEDREKVEYLF